MGSNLQSRCKMCKMCKEILFFTSMNTEDYWSTVWSPPSFALNVSPLSSVKKKQAEKETTWPTQRNNLKNFSFELLQLCWWRQCYVWDLTPPKWALLFHAGQRRSLMCRSTSLYGWNSARLADMECLKLAIVSQSFYQIISDHIRSDWANNLLEIWSWHLCFAEEPAKVCETCTQHVNLAHFSTQQDVQQIKQL